MGREIATKLGISERTLHLLVRIWREKKQPADLVGSGRPRTRRAAFTAIQADIIAAAVKDKPNEVVERVIERAEEIANERQVTLPSATSLRREIKKVLGPRLPPNSFAAGADYVVDHVALDLPVQARGGGVTMPIATVVIDIARAAVVAVELREDAPEVGPTAFAIAAWLQHGVPLIGDGKPATLALEIFTGETWHRLAGVLSELPVAIMLKTRARLGRSPIATSLLGDRHQGIWLRSRNTVRLSGDRHPDVPAGGQALTMDQATDVVTSRWVKRLATCRPPRREESVAIRRVQLVPLDRSVQPKS